MCIPEFVNHNPAGGWGAKIAQKIIFISSSLSPPFPSAGENILEEAPNTPTSQLQEFQDARLAEPSWQAIKRALAVGEASKSPVFFLYRSHMVSVSHP